jgi:Flp pilus assembly protein CpaB
VSLSSGTMSVGVLAIFSGLLGAYGLRAVLLTEPPQAAAKEKFVTIPLATADLPAGRIIRFGDVGIHRLTPKQVSERRLGNPSVMMDSAQVMGRRVRVAIKQGEPFLTTSMYLEGSATNVSELLRPGFRAVSLQIPELMGGMTDVGTMVDVVFRSESRKGKTIVPETTMTLIEGVEVLNVERPKAVVQDSGNIDLRRTNGRGYVPPSPPTVTLAVTLEQANILRTVEGRGVVSLVPRSADELPLSRSLAKPKRFTLENLLGIEPARPPFKTEIYRRTDRQIRQFGDDELEKALSYVAPPPAGQAAGGATDQENSGSRSP